MGTREVTVIRETKEFAPLLAANDVQFIKLLCDRSLQILVLLNVCDGLVSVQMFSYYFNVVFLRE